jgi:Chitobiase/beta-hexosaminidase C-terminal domain
MAAQQAAQQAVMMQDQATQQAVMMQQQATQTALAQQQATQANIDAANAAATPGLSAIGYEGMPKFSVKAGSYAGSITVKMKGYGNTYIYYTTDGWTPTAYSTRYTGPLTISSTTRLQAVTIGPGGFRSLVTSADYVIGSSPIATASSAAVDGTPRVRLEFTAPVKEKGLEVGDKLPVALAEDLIIGGAVVTPKGTPALATVTQAYGPRFGGFPGSISFAVHSVSANGKTIPLSGTETIEGQSNTRRVQKLFLIPGVGPALVFQRGRDPEIARGAMLSAVVEPQAGSTASTR